MKFPKTNTVAATRPNNFGFRGWVYGGKYSEERWLYTLHRATGLGVLLYLPMHLIVTSFKNSQHGWDAVMGIVNTGALPIGEFLVFAGAVFHMLNGIRLGVTELGFMLRKPERPEYPYTFAAGKQKPLVWLVLLLTVIIVAYGGYEFFIVAGH